MTIQTVSLSSLEPPATNPRSAIDTGALEGLAERIRCDGSCRTLPWSGQVKCHCISNSCCALFIFMLADLQKENPMKEVFNKRALNRSSIHFAAQFTLWGAIGLATPMPVLLAPFMAAAMTIPYHVGYVGCLMDAAESGRPSEQTAQGPAAPPQP